MIEARIEVDFIVLLHYFSYKYEVVIQIHQHQKRYFDDDYFVKIIIYPNNIMSDMKIFQNKFPFNDNVDISLLCYMPPPPFNGGHHSILAKKVYIIKLIFHHHFLTYFKTEKKLMKY